jgi:hypothetical protein
MWRGHSCLRRCGTRFTLETGPIGGKGSDAARDSLDLLVHIAEVGRRFRLPIATGFSAVEEQLGLKLVSVQQIPLDVFVIDHIEKIPVEN